MINPAQIRTTISGKKILGRYWSEDWYILPVTNGQKPRCSNMITNHAVNRLSCRMQSKAIDAENRFALRKVQRHSSLLV
jgi:hypothetical protein